MPPSFRRTWLVWTAGFLGWTVTTLGQIHVEQQFTIFGAYGCADLCRTVRAAAHALLPCRTAAGPPPVDTRIEATA